MNSAGTRKAALALATMHPADRRWVLARLPEAWRSALNPLINEAQRYTTLDAELLQAVLADEPTYLAREVPPPDVLIVVLDRLSPPWAARVLAAAAPDHADIYLAACEKTRAHAVRHELSRMPDPFPSALADSLARYLDSAAPSARAGAAP
ncbi:hypothetical protein [Dyella caseinilytica]|uniref:Uncharacterized protein n=1 Tax=Dyella caseinilytica TaxID=1849581 RepID=A0ABX7GQG2_9GAMM|nr:hypothetical protein [Dyella caseinilytica]QRN52062.1 hypothetical protein ISN74_11145 [Dyella caseinilytica]GGA15747.1 hypothetical protein GCM10011408_42140 [Dyella caseinilytica]